MDKFTLKTKPYYYNEDSDPRYFKLTCTPKATEIPGETKVDWTFVATYEGSSIGLNIWCSCVLTSTINKGTLVSGALPSYKQTTWKGVRFNNGGSSAEGIASVKLTGSFIIKHTDAGEAKISFKADCSMYSTSSTNDASGSMTLTGNFPFTATTAPTSFSATGTSVADRVIPGGTITLKWSGAADGIANPIKEYKIYYAISSQGGAPSVSSSSITVASGISSYTFTVPADATRGHKIVFAIQAIGTKTDYSSILKNSGAISINIKPAAPVVTFSVSKLPNRGGTFGISLDSKYQVYYKTKNGPKTEALITSTTNFSYANPGNFTQEEFYFRNYDGLEYSASTTKIINFNVIPTVTCSFGSGDPTYHSPNMGGYASRNNTYYISRKLNIAITGDDGDSVYNNTFYVHYAVADTNTYTKVKLGTTSSTSLTIDDIRKYISIPTKVLVYYFSVEVNDGYDTKAADFYKTGTSERLLHFLPSRPSAIKNYSNLTPNTNTSHFYHNLQFSFDRDTGFSSARIEAYSTSNTGVASFEKDIVHGSDTTSSVTLTQNDLATFTAGASYTFKIFLKRGNIEYLLGTSPLLMASRVPTPQNAKLSSAQFSPYGSDTGWTCSINNYGGFTNGFNSDYDLNLSGFSFRWEVDGKTSNYVSITGQISGSNLVFSLKHSTFYDYLAQLQLSNRKTYDGILRLRAVNNFGISSTVALKCSITYNDQAPQLEAYGLYVGTTNNTGKTWYAFSSLPNKFLKSGVSLAYQVKARDYYGLEKIEVLMSTDNKNWQNYGTTLTTFDNNPESDLVSTATLITNYVSNAANARFQANMEELVTANEKVYFKLKVTNRAGKVITTNSETFTYYSHTEPRFSAVSTSYSGESIIFSDRCDSAGFTVNGGKYITSVTREVQQTVKGQTLGYEQYTSSNNGEIASTGPWSIAGNMSDAEFCYIQLRISTTQTLYLTSSTDASAPKVVTTRVGYSPMVVIYNIVPSLALRTNWVGINTEQVDSDGVMSIHAYSGKDRVYFYSGDSVSYIELSEYGEPQIVNFIIDCGSW